MQTIDVVKKSIEKKYYIDVIFSSDYSYKTIDLKILNYVIDNILDEEIINKIINYYNTDTSDRITLIKEFRSYLEEYNKRNNIYVTSLMPEISERSYSPPLKFCKEFINFAIVAIDKNKKRKV